MAFDIGFECLLNATDLKIALWRLCANFTVFFYGIKILDSRSRCNLNQCKLDLFKLGPEMG